MKYTFQHYLDISTSASSLTMIQINAGGMYTLQRIKHLFGAFKYIKYGRVSVKLLPASTLPVDPLGLSYDSADPQTVDPRDQMNPGLVRITNGEDIFKDFAGLSDTVQEQLYRNTMLDPRWSKFMLQSGFKRSAVPLYWNVGQLAQDPYPGAVVNIPGKTSTNTTGLMTSTTSVQMFDNAEGTGNSYDRVPLEIMRNFTSDPRGLFQTGHRGRMSWMPTDAFYDFINPSNEYNATSTPMIQPLPECECITVLLPKAYKTRYYYRLFITETVYLAGIKNTGINTDEYNEYRAIDNFMFATFPEPKSPAQYVSVTPLLPNGPARKYFTPYPPNTGGD